MIRNVVNTCPARSYAPGEQQPSLAQRTEPGRIDPALYFARMTAVSCRSILDQHVVPRPPVEDVRAGAALERVFAGTAGQEVVAGAAGEGVVAVAADQGERDRVGEG